jgi:oligopeptide/dipeptide ABC transporter ATP-binding protein
MAQRILIVMGTIPRPQVIIADEPGASLDVRVQNRAPALLDKLGTETGAAILMIAHNFGVVRKFARQVVVMYGGTVVETGQTDEILANPVHPYTRALLAAVPRLDGTRLPTPIDGVVPSYVDAPSGCRLAARCPIVIDRCKATRPVLEPADATHRAHATSMTSRRLLPDIQTCFPHMRKPFRIAARSRVHTSTTKDHSPSLITFISQEANTPLFQPAHVELSETLGIPEELTEEDFKEGGAIQVPANR